MTNAIDGVTSPSRSSWRTSWRTLAALLFLLAVTAGFYWKLTISREYTYLEGPDLAIQVRPWLDYQAREFHAGRLPLWDQYEWGGQPLAGQVQPGTFNPLNWILFAMPLERGHIPIRTLHWYWVLIHWLGAVFCYALCRSLKAGVWASLLGGSIFALTGFVGHTDWPQILMSSIWIPLVLLFFARVFRGERPRSSAAMCGAALAMQFLSGHHQVPVFTAVLMGGLWAWHVFGRPQGVSAWKQHLPHFLCFVAVFGLMSAVQVLPAVEYGKQAVRWAGVPEPLHWNQKVPFSVHAEYSLQARSIPGMVIPGISLHANPFVGIVAMSLALAAVGLGWRQRNVRLFAAVALGGLLLALGKDFPLYRLIYATVPMVEKARFPAMAVVLAQVGVAVLAAQGLEALRAGSRSKFVVRGLLVFSGAVLAIYAGLAILHREPANYGAATVAAVALALAAVLAWLTRVPGREPGRARIGGALVFVLFLIEAVTAAPRLARFDRRDSYAHMMESQQDIAAFLRAEAGWFRFEVDDTEIPYNFGVFYGIEQFGGGVSSMLARVHRILGHDETPRLFGIRYRVARTPSNAAQVPVFQSRSGLKVYRDPRIGEPLWTVHPSPCGGADGLRVVTRLPEVFAIEADMACAGQVVAGDPWFPGWRAWVDGRRVRILEAESVVRGVALDAGRHRIEYRFHPGSGYWGAALCALGITLTACLWARDARGVIDNPHG
ncbi:MAG TPA: YfhO family protein [Candidatus Acidoferrales bacterium]|nr:YfhO family protein [Candidatus Acidoferrales bacterium]